MNARMPYTRMRMRVCVLLPERCFRTAKIRGDLQTSEMTLTRFRRHHFTETCRPLSESLPDVATSLRGFSEDLRETSESENFHEIAEKSICMRKKSEKVEACLVFRDRTPPIPAEKSQGLLRRNALSCSASAVTQSSMASLSLSPKRKEIKAIHAQKYGRAARAQKNEGPPNSERRTRLTKSAYPSRRNGSTVDLVNWSYDGSPHVHCSRKGTVLI